MQLDASHAEPEAVGTLQRCGRWWRTVRHLRPSQMLWRSRYIVQRRLEAMPWVSAGRRRRRADGGELAPQRHWRVDAAHHRPPVSHPSARRMLHDLRNGQLTLLAQPLPFAGGKDWCLQGGRRQHRLWRHHLHYHEWLVELAACDPADQEEAHGWIVHYLNDWLETCPAGAPGFTHYPWNSYAIAKRIPAWCRLHALLPPSAWQRLPGLEARFLQSLAEQAAYLADHVEWDLRGNHLMRDAVGLAWAGRMFTGPAAQHWLRQSTRLAADQLHEQVLPDGGHFERSPMYHCQVMDEVWQLAQLLPDPAVRQQAGHVWRRMQEALGWWRHPDGLIPLFNDATLHGGPDPQDLLAPTPADERPQPRGGKFFPDTGLVVWRGTPWTVFFDVGEVGPTYQPGHAHADTLTLEASFGRQRLLVDPGTFAYDPDQRRRYDRSTAAHNTVTVDGADSSEVWHIFRVGRRARPREVSAEIHTTGLRSAATHDGYRHLPGSPQHGRCVQLADHGALVVEDRIEGRRSHAVQGGWLLAPGWQATPAPGGWMLRSAGGRVRVRLHSDAPVRCDIQPALVHPDFGVEQETRRLVWQYAGTLPLRVVTRFQGDGGQ